MIFTTRVQKWLIIFPLSELQKHVLPNQHEGWGGYPVVPHASAINSNEQCGEPHEYNMDSISAK